ncbi:MAG: universal stress protein [Armatimonadetes bacterium]|nr:universal stress protein [Armatimonadota bacterium]
MFAKLLVPTDFAAWSDAALELLDPLRDLGAEEAILLHVLDPGPLFPWSEMLCGAATRVEERARQALEERRPRIEGAGLRVDARVVQGPPVETIIRCASEEQAHLILMGSRRRSFLKQAVLGSVSENVIRHAPVPVLLSKWSADEPPAADRSAFAHVLFPTDFSPCAEKAFQCLTALAGAGMREATIIHVQDIRLLASAPDDHEGSEEGLNIRYLEQVVDMDRLVAAERELESLGVTTRVMVREGLPFREILRAAAEEQVTAILLGSHGKSSVAEILLGSVSAEVIRQARVPVLVIRRDPEEPE